MELFGEKALHSIAELCGVNLKNDQENSFTEVDNNHDSTNDPDNKTKYIIRQGIEDDVLIDSKSK